MISIEVRENDVSRVERTLAQFAGDSLGACVNRATYRAATSVRKIAVMRITSIYTIKSRDLKKMAPIKKSGLASTIEIKGPFLPVTDYKASSENRGVFVAIKKGRKKLVFRSFTKKNGQFRKRLGPERLPIHALFGPAAAQMFGNPKVVEEMEREGMKVYEERLMHELERLVGGA